MDWGESRHDLAVIDDSGHVVSQLRVDDGADGLAAILAALRQVKRTRRSIPIGIETGRGLMVAGLRAAGQPVVVLNATQVANYRNRLAAQKKKSDRGDARLLAHVLRVDRDAHRPAPDLTPQAETIRELARAHRKAVRDARHLGIRLRSLLRDYHPAAALAWADLQGGLTRPDARLILAAAPTPPQAARLTHKRLETLLDAT